MLIVVVLELERLILHGTSFGDGEVNRAAEEALVEDVEEEKLKVSSLRIESLRFSGGVCTDNWFEPGRLDLSWCKSWMLLKLVI
ncbi:hypothetical protein WICPIJ_009841 [Wickerhamomyces pijperi]|uniref:Uncharacterized protein n=1 Tax=Wickerhamomyces pijperi TaxID=599730 RepID=A0A9P8PJC7_WICPI|nr:hypothetical protein WICPIJ_009841 [Wickerhamomyces pijperi]